MIRLALVGAVVLALAGCDRPKPPEPPATAPAAPAAERSTSTAGSLCFPFLGPSTSLGSGGLKLGPSLSPGISLF